jgi:hypothetical protein
MRFQSGRFAGKTTEEIFLKFPDWAAWNMSRHPDAKQSREFNRLQDRFDAKPLKVDCDGRCGRRARRCSAYANSPSLKFWCDNCNSSQGGASTGKLSTVYTFDDVLGHIRYTADGHRDWTRKIVRALARAKGLPKRVGEKAAQTFFG